MRLFRRSVSEGPLGAADGRLPRTGMPEAVRDMPGSTGALLAEPADQVLPRGLGAKAGWLLP